MAAYGTQRHLDHLAHRARSRSGGWQSWAGGAANLIGAFGALNRRQAAARQEREFGESMREILSGAPEGTWGKRDLPPQMQMSLYQLEQQRAQQGRAQAFDEFAGQIPTMSRQQLRAAGAAAPEGSRADAVRLAGAELDRRYDRRMERRRDQRAQQQHELSVEELGLRRESNALNRDMAVLRRRMLEREDEREATSARQEKLASAALQGALSSGKPLEWLQEDGRLEGLSPSQIGEVQQAAHFLQQDLDKQKAMLAEQGEDALVADYMGKMAKLQNPTVGLRAAIGSNLIPGGRIPEMVRFADALTKLRTSRLSEEQQELATGLVTGQIQPEDPRLDTSTRSWFASYQNQMSQARTYSEQARDRNERDAQMQELPSARRELMRAVSPQELDAVLSGVSEKPHLFAELEGLAGERRQMLDRREQRYQERADEVQALSKEIYRLQNPAPRDAIVGFADGELEQALETAAPAVQRATSQLRSKLRSQLKIRNPRAAENPAVAKLYVDSRSGGWSPESLRSAQQALMQQGRSGERLADQLGRWANERIAAQERGEAGPDDHLDELVRFLEHLR